MNDESNESKYEFKAEIKKLLQILSKSLYQHKEIFLRELISNSSDALQKMHLVSLQEKDIVDPDLNLEIEIFFDSKANTLIVSDTGIGMSKEELIDNLGTIAGSGSQKFMEFLKSSEENKDQKLDLDIIGQFGVGFYSVYMVADEVKVVSKSYKKDEPAYEWESDGSGVFNVKEAEKDRRGTEVILHLREDENEYLKQYRIEEIIKKYSNFLPYPIYVTDKTDADTKQEVDVGDEEVKSEDSEVKTEEKSETEAEAEAEAEEKKEPERKSVNETKPLWKRSSNNITDEDYQNFYHYISSRYDNYADVINYNVDGKVQFRSILFIPGSRNNELFQQDAEYGLALFSKNVMIMRNSKELLPLWMRFIKGVVDSEDIPLNISRETIQSDRTIAKMKDLVEKRVIKELDQLSEENPEKFQSIWKEYGVFVKEGIISERLNQDKLLKLLRFPTSKTKNGESIGLEEYIKRMPEGQEKIYYLIGENLNTLKISPHLGYYDKKGYEVIFFTEPIDNFLMMNVRDYKTTIEEGEEKKDKLIEFSSIDVTEKKSESEKEGKEEDKEKEKEEEEEYKPSEELKKFLEYVKSVLGEKIIDATVSTKLYNSACRLANPAGGMSSSMQRAMRYWGQNNQGKNFEIPHKMMEFNPEHPTVKGLVDLYDKEPENGKIKPIIEQMFENSLLAEGDLPDPSLMVPRINQLLEMLITGKDDVKSAIEDIPEDNTESEKPEKESEKDLEPKSDSETEKKTDN